MSQRYSPHHHQSPAAAAAARQGRSGYMGSAQRRPRDYPHLGGGGGVQGQGQYKAYGQEMVCNTRPNNTLSTRLINTISTHPINPLNAPSHNPLNPLNPPHQHPPLIFSQPSQPSRPLLFFSEQQDGADYDDEDSPTERVARLSPVVRELCLEVFQMRHLDDLVDYLASKGLDI